MSRVDTGPSQRSATRAALLLVAVVVVGVAIVFAIVNRHTALDNDSALARKDATEQLGVETPNLEGPDDLDLAPLVSLSTSGSAFDHEPVDRNTLESRLRTYRANFSLIHPGEVAPREVLLACSPSVPSESIFSVLDTVRLLGFDRASLVFQTMRTRESASLEETRPQITAARVSLAGETASQGTRAYIHLSEVQNCTQLSERVIALRRAGQAATLAVRAGH